MQKQTVLFNNLNCHWCTNVQHNIQILVMVVSSGDDGFTLSLIDGNEGQFLWIQGERTLFMKNTQIMFLTSNTNTDLTVLSGLTASEQNACMHLNVQHWGYDNLFYYWNFKYSHH